MNVLVLHDRPEEANKLIFSLERELHAQVDWVDNYPDALDFFLKDQKIDFLLVQNKPELTKIFMYVSSLNMKLPYILVGPESDQAIEAFPDLPVMGFVKTVTDLKNIAILTRQAVKEGLIPRNAEQEEKFCRIPTELLLEVVPLKADIFIRLSAVKYVKMFRKGMEFKADDARRYLDKKKVQFLYIQADEVDGFIDHFQETVTELAAREDLAPEEQYEVASQILESVGSLGEQLGFNEKVQEIAQQGIKMTMKSIGKSPKLSKMFDIIKGQKGTYLSDHSVAIAHIACAIAAKLEWPSESTFHKLSLAAFFHDIALRKPELAEIESLSEIEGKNFSDEDIELIKHHPNAAAEVIRKFSEVPPDVDVILSQHHERSDGSGFPRGLTSHHIAPLAAVFIVAHDLVRFIYEEPEDFSFQGFVQRFKYSKTYTKGNFAKAVSAIDFPERKAA